MKYLLALAAHFLGDFVFQSSQMAREKSGNRTVFIRHCLIYACLTALALLWYAPLANVALAVFLIAFSHGAVDQLKGRLLRRLASPKRAMVWVFMADQLLHLLVITLAVQLPQTVNAAGKMLLAGLGQHFSVAQIHRGAALIFLFIVLSAPAASFIKQILSLISLENDSPAGCGYLIGILERFIIVALYLSRQLEALGLVLAAKSIARFKQLDDRDFAERYLVGTLLSVLLALLGIAAAEVLLR